MPAPRAAAQAGSDARRTAAEQALAAARLELTGAQQALQVLVEELRDDYETLTTRPSGQATHERWQVSHKERITLEVPPGTHLLQVRMLAPEGADCLIRIRQPESDAGD